VKARKQLGLLRVSAVDVVGLVDTCSNVVIFGP
jgi:hypothetical protein